MTPSGSETRPPTILAFDRLAPDYDALSAGEIFKCFRERTHGVFVRCFAAGARVLEIGCGTGLDTRFLASRGIHVVACDPSEEMVSRSLQRLAREQLTERAHVIPCGLQDLQAYLEALGYSEPFDGIVSNFGALNCVQHLAPLRALAQRHLREGGCALLGLMTRVCAIEALYFVARGRPRLAVRRLGQGAVPVPVAGVPVSTFYHRVADVREALAPDLRLHGILGLGVVMPPPYMEPRWRTLPSSMRRGLRRADALLASLPPFNRLGDHVLLQFVKGAAHA